MIARTGLSRVEKDGRVRVELTDAETKFYARSARNQVIQDVKVEVQPLGHAEPFVIVAGCRYVIFPE
jgi:hypothetical protein